MIRSYLEDNHGHSAFAVSTYVALSEFASDAQSETFTVPISQIARRAGASYRTTAEILNRLESLGLIRIQRNTVPGTKEHAPSTYTMLGMPCLTLGKRDAKCLPKILNKGKKTKNREVKGQKGASSDARTSSFQKYPIPESEEEMYETLGELGIEYFPDYDGNFFEDMEKHNWTIRGKPIWDWPAVYKARLKVTMSLWENSAR
jgi:hypothetical protein